MQPLLTRILQILFTKKHVYLVFLSKDFSGDGSISIEEFAKLVASPKLQFWISSLDEFGLV